jgi:hypothetical protein
MWRRAVAAAAMLAGVMTVSAQAASASSRGTLTLVGSRSATIAVRLSGAPDVGHGFTITAQTAGSYAGYLISDTRGKPLAGGVMVKGVGMAPGTAVPLAYSPAPLRPGVYVVTLLTDGPAKITIPLTGRTHLTVRPTHPAKVFAEIVRSNVTPSTVAGTPVRYSRTPVPAGHYSLALVSAFFTDSDGQAGYGDACFTTLYQCEVGSTEGDNSSIYTGPEWGQAAGDYSGSSYPADFAAGTDAVFDNADVAIDSVQNGFVLLLS